jgi:VWFA-related protein
MMRARSLGLILCVSLLAAVPLVRPAPAGGAAAQAIQQAPQTMHIEVNLVNVFATVRDKRTKRIVSDMEQNDFKITEDNAEQKISSFSRDSNLPVTLGLLIDTSGSEEQTLGAEQEAGVRFLARVLRKGDLATVINFDTDVNLLADLTDDQGMLDRAIQRARINAPMAMGPLGGNQPGTIFYDAVYLACHDKLAEEAGRKALVILTDADDEGSRYRIEDAVEAAQRTDTVVHILLIARGLGNESVARKLTDATGGRTIVVRSEKNLEQAFDEISEELRSQYTLSYSSSNGAHDGSYRKIKVESTRKDLDVLARRGYYAPKN